jgi:hypothetical protein
MPRLDNAQNRIRHAPAEPKGTAYNSFAYINSHHEALHPDTKRD